MICPKCNVEMGGSGTIWSGGHKIPRWRCSKCGKTKAKKYEEIEMLEIMSNRHKCGKTIARKPGNTNT